MSDKLYSPIVYDPISKIYYKQELNTHVGIVLNAQEQFVNKLIKQRDKLEAQKIAFARSYKQVVEENEKLEVENEKLKIKNKYLLNVVKMSEHIQMHTNLEEN